MHAEEGAVAGVVGGWGRDVERAEVFLAFEGLGFLLLGVWFLLCFLRFRVRMLGVGLVFGLGLALGLFLWGILGGRGLGGSLKIIGMNTMNNFPLGEY